MLGTPAVKAFDIKYILGSQSLHYGDLIFELWYKKIGETGIISFKFQYSWPCTRHLLQFKSFVTLFIRFNDAVVYRYVCRIPMWVILENIEKFV